MRKPASLFFEVRIPSQLLKGDAGIKSLKVTGDNLYPHSFDDPETPVCATPEISPAAGSSLRILTDLITLTTATEGASLFYRYAFGDAEFTDWLPYSEPFSLNQFDYVALEAKAAKTNYQDSEISSTNYLITTIGTVDSPEISIAGGTYYAPQSVTLLCATPGATIYYTTNGSDPTPDDTLYTAPISLSASATLKVKAFKENYTDSEVAFAVYVFSAPAAPVSAAASSITDAGMTANWAASDYATGYRLDVSTISNFATFVAGYEDKTVSGTNATITGLSENTTYYYRIRAISAIGTSTNSDTITQATAYPATFTFTAGTNDNISELRLTLSAAQTVTCSAGITICDTAGGTYGSSIAFPTSGAKSIFVKRTDSTATSYLYLTKNTISDFGTAFNGSGTGWRYNSGGTEAGMPLLAIDVSRFATTVRFFSYYNATSSRTVTLNGNFNIVLQIILYPGSIWATNWNGTNIPSNLTAIFTTAAGVAITYSGSFGGTPLTYMVINGSSNNMTGTTVGSGANISTFQITNHRIVKISDTDLVTLITSLADRTGNVPNTIVIGDYALWQTPHPDVIAAIAYLKSKKTNVTTVTLGA